MEAYRLAERRVECSQGMEWRVYDGRLLVITKAKNSTGRLSSRPSERTNSTDTLFLAVWSAAPGENALLFFLALCGPLPQP